MHSYATSKHFPIDPFHYKNDAIWLDPMLQVTEFPASTPNPDATSANVIGKARPPADLKVAILSCGNDCELCFLYTAHNLIILLNIFFQLLPFDRKVYYMCI